MSNPTRTSAVHRLHAKWGDNDCTIAAMATIFRREPGEVLIAASKVSPTVWRTGLSCKEMLKVAHRLKIKARWKHGFDPEEDTGVLVIGFNDKVGEHCVVLLEGWIIEPEHDPVSVWRFDDYYKATNSYGTTLLEVVE